MSDDYIRRGDAIRLAEQGQVQGFPWQFQMLVRLPPADVVPVVHAYWRDTGSGQECSACKEIQYGYDTGRYFCANCGAKMDGDDKYE